MGIIQLEKFHNNNLFSYNLSKLSLNTIVGTIALNLIAFVTVLVGSTFGANFWCGHGAVSAGTCCWNGEMESAGWKHSSVDNFVSSSGCPSGKTRKTVIAVPGTSHKCYSCARSA